MPIDSIIAGIAALVTVSIAPLRLISVWFVALMDLKWMLASEQRLTPGRRRENEIQSRFVLCERGTVFELKVTDIAEHGKASLDYAS